MRAQLNLIDMIIKPLIGPFFKSMVFIFENKYVFFIKIFFDPIKRCFPPNIYSGKIR